MPSLQALIIPARQVYTRFCLYVGRLHRILGILLFSSVFAVANTEAVAKSTHRQITILYILSGQNAVYTDFQSATSMHLRKLNESFRITENVMTASELVQSVNQSQSFPKADLVISVGSVAGETVSSFNDQTPVLFTLITKSTYDTFLARFGSNFSSERQFSAIFVNIPVEQHLAFIVAAMPGVSNVGIAITESNKVADEIRKIKGNYYGLNLSVLTVANKKEFYDKLPGLLKKADIILSLPDTELYDKQTIRHLLISAYRQKKAIVGYSSAYVKAGALMALFATTDNIGKQVAYTVLDAFKGSKMVLPAYEYPAYSTIEINYWVAQSLGIPVNSREEVMKKMKRSGTLN